MRKYSKEATLRELLQGMWKGIQEAKNDPLVQEKYPRGLGFIEKLVTDLGKKAKRDPNFRLTEKQVKLLNKFLSGSSGVLSAVLRRHVVRHCRGNQCTMVSPNEFRFEYVPPTPTTYKITGKVSKTDYEGDVVQSATIDEKAERLTDVLGKYIPFFQGFSQRGAMREIEVVGTNNEIKMTSIYRPNPNDVFDAYTQYATMELYVNGKAISKQMAQKVAEYYLRK